MEASDLDNIFVALLKLPRTETTLEMSLKSLFVNSTSKSQVELERVETKAGLNCSIRLNMSCVLFQRVGQSFFNDSFFSWHHLFLLGQ